jgi:C4-dicarboxylate-specific signal transduction histidine kinase
MPDGSVKQVHVVLEAVCSDPANRQYVGTVMDITARKQAEDAASKAQMELAHATRVMTVGELTASIAHEINQPLSAIVTNADAGLRWLGADSPNLEETSQAIRRIIRDGKRASAVVSRMRALFKKAPTAKEPLEINEAIHDILALTQNEVHRSRVLLRTKLANDLPLVVGDRIQLQQVILNLLINAVQAVSELPEGPRKVDLTSEEVATNSEQTEVLITVRDSGPGLDPQHLDRLFDAFYTTKSHGLGIGLAISRSIIEAHGGRLWARANAPRGAVFQFTLPAMTAPA